MGQVSSYIFSSNQTNVAEEEIVASGKTKANFHSLRRRQFQSVENYVVAWLDSNIDEASEDIQYSIGHLRRIVNSITTITDRQQFHAYLAEVKNEHLFDIVSGTLGQSIVPKISHMNQLVWIYVFCGDIEKHRQWALNYPKVKEVFNQIQELCHVLKDDVRQDENNLTTMSIIPPNVAIHINELESSFMYSQVLKEILLEYEWTSKEKEQLVEFCRVQYAGNNTQLEMIEEFKRTYHCPSAVRWYIREGFLYSMLNKALRTQDTEVLMKMGFVVRDLHRQIEQMHAQQNHQQKMIVYRGQGMSFDEFNKIRGSEGGLLFFNNFLSTTLDQNVALNFVDQSRKSHAELTAVLFRIEVASNISRTPFASVDEVSDQNYNEKEILFSMNTVFRICDVRNLNSDLFQIDLISTEDDDQQLARLTQYIRKETQGPTGLHRMAKLMIAMGNFDKAADIYLTLLEATSNDDRLQRAHYYHQLGYINDHKKDLTSALSYYQQALQIYLTYTSPNDRRLGETLSNIGSVLKQQGDLTRALEYYEQALNIERQASHPDEVKIATHYSNIGAVFREQEKFAEALESYKRALEIQIRCLPSLHSSITYTYGNIGGVYRAMRDNTKALKYIQESLDIKQKSLPPDHQDLAVAHNNMAHVLEDLNQIAEAIRHAEKALSISRLSFGPDNSIVKKRMAYLDELRRK